MLLTEKQIQRQKRNIEIVRLYRSGKTLRSCGTICGVGKDTVRKVLLAQGITERRFWSNPRSVLSPEQKIQIKILSFWNRVAVTADPDRCWEWAACKNQRGYGRVSWNGKTYYARQIAMQIYNNKILSGYVLDSCGNNKCVNPNHLKEFPTKKRKRV